jgi:hypothetical protein
MEKLSGAQTFCSILCVAICATLIAYVIIDVLGNRKNRK